jgi:phosphate:Na+ symporter
LNYGGFQILNLLGGVALLLWAARQVKTGVQRAFGDQLRALLKQATQNRFIACLLGIGVATALQSSTATGSLLVSFVSRNLMDLAPALAVMLGADLGSALVVQFLSFDLRAFIPILILIGVSAFMISDNALIKQIGRVIIGLALMILSLGMIVGASSSMRDSASFGYVMSLLNDERLIALVISASSTWMLHSSVAMVLLISAITGNSVISPSLGLVLLIGANIGAGLIPLALGWNEPQMARRMLIGNLLFRSGGALLALVAMPVLTDRILPMHWDATQIIAFSHLAFNTCLGLVFIPFVETMAHFLCRIIPDDPTHDTKASDPLHLDENLLEQPSLALGAASREVMRLAERVEIMLSEVIFTFSDQDDHRQLAIKKLDDDVDALQESIKLYLTRLTRHTLDENEARRAIDLILFTTNLEHVGDIIDKSLLALAAKRRRNAVHFSEAGWDDLTQFHARILRQMKLAMTVFMTQDIAMARELMTEKDNVRIAEKAATEQHLARLREGSPASIETSALHLDVLRDLKRINAHIVSIAHPILEASGEIRQSRLRRKSETTNKSFSPS